MAVKKPDAKILIPVKNTLIAMIRKPTIIKSRRTGSFDAKISTIGRSKSSATTSITKEKLNIIRAEIANSL